MELKVLLEDTVSTTLQSKELGEQLFQPHSPPLFSSLVFHCEPEQKPQGKEAKWDNSLGHRAECRVDMTQVGDIQHNSVDSFYYI